MTSGQGLRAGSGGQSPWRPKAVPQGCRGRQEGGSPASGVGTALEGDSSHLPILPERKQAQRAESDRWGCGSPL